MSKYIKYSFLIVAVITLFFIDYSNLAFKNNFTPYIFLIGSILGFAAMLIAEKKPLKVNTRRLIAKLGLIYTSILILIILLRLFFDKTQFNKVGLSLFCGLITCVVFAKILYKEKNK